jgi:asparagine synthase (glutamine-hydrolysing)
MIIEVDGDWSVSGATLAKGCAFVHERFLRSADIAAVIESCETEESWLATISSLNGSFAVVTGHTNEVWAAVDRVRSIPLFYGLHQGSLVLSDRAERVRACVGDDSQSPETSLEFLLTGYVTGSETLFPNVKQIQAGEALSFVTKPKPKLDRRRYFEWRHRDPWPADNNALIERLHAVHRHVARRLVASLEGRQAVVPLSGGYDSRLIAVMLKEEGYDNVLCYTYGLPDNWEARISKEVARYLGFRWKFVPYSGAKWREWGATATFKRYCATAGNLTAVPHVQDWPALFALQQQRAVAVDGVLVPGHSGDFVAGSHIPHWFAQRASITRNQLLRTILDSHYSLWDWPPAKLRLTEELTRRIDAIGGPLRDGSPAEAADQLEFWDMNERQAKFICNSVRVYDFFDHDWRLPLFDLELLDFWSHVPVEMRVRRSLYIEYVGRYQNLPVPTPNRDRGKLAGALIHLVNNFGLHRLAKSVQYRLRRAQWKSVYESCTDPPLAWFTLIDRELFRRTYTGKQTLHAYLARSGAQGLLRQVTDADSPVNFS